MANEKLTDRAIKNAKVAATVRYLTDGDGLRLRLMPTGAKHWLYRFRLDGKESTYMIGAYPEVSLQDARSRLADARRHVAKGRNPSIARKVAKSDKVAAARSTLGAVAKDWLAYNRQDWSEAHYERNEMLLRLILLPRLGAMPVADITEQMLLVELTAYYRSGRKESARRAGAIAVQIFRFAKDSHLIKFNPALEIAENSRLKKPEVTHFTALKAAQVGPMLRALAASNFREVTKAAIILMLQTGLRDSSLRGAQWKEIDLQARTWTVPAIRMKRRIEHTVPLPNWAIETLAGLALITNHGTDSFVFASSGKAGFLSESTLRVALHRLGFEVTAHGMRSLLTDVLNEQGFNADAIERQLHHIEKNKVRAAYLRSDFFEQRVAMMQWFSDWALAQRDEASSPAMPANVVQFGRAA